MSFVAVRSRAGSLDSNPMLLGAAAVQVEHKKLQSDTTIVKEVVSAYTKELSQRAVEKAILRTANAEVKKAEAMAGAAEAAEPLRESWHTAEAAEPLREGVLDIRRMAQITRGRATDHAGELVVLPNRNFDLSKTIFNSLEGVAPRAVASARLGKMLFWQDSVALQISSAFASVPVAPQHDQALLEFLTNDCSFAMEHADGHFMDHLKFCYEYSFAHYRERSPRVLLLHSIMGVGTNFFPMEAAKIPHLQSLLTEFEFQQVAAFPSILRLLYHGELLRELEQLDSSALERLDCITFYRVIDNEHVTMSGKDFWDQLNYQLIHLLDFLPAASWKRNADDNFLRSFSAIHAILTRAGKLVCKVDFDATEGQSTASDQTPMSLGSLIRTVLPSAVLLRMSEKAIGKFSAKIGHNLTYQLKFCPI